MLQTSQGLYLDDDDSINSDEINKRNHGIYLLKRLFQIKKTNANHIRLSKLLKAFQIWSHQFPLASKCDEYHKQLRERCLLIDNIRSAYLKDVISLKIHLDNLIKISTKINHEDTNYDNTSNNNDLDTLIEMKESLYDIHTIPSLDLSKFIKDAKDSLQQTSIQLKSSLVDNGLMDPETLMTYNPWEQSRGYRRLLRQQNPSYKPIVSNGECIDVAKPIGNKLFIKYCKECIGVTTFIKKWNDEIEVALQFKADNADLDNRINEYRNLISKLNNTIEKQETKIVELEGHNNEILRSQHWFTKWTELSLTTPSQANDLYEDMSRYKALHDMAAEDYHSLTLNYQRKEEELHRSMHLNEKQMRTKVYQLEKQLELVNKDKSKLIKEVFNYQKELIDKNNEVVKINNIRDHAINDMKTFDIKFKSLENLNQELQNIIDIKENNYNILRDDMNSKVNNLNNEIINLNQNISKQEDRIDELREKLKKQHETINNKSNKVTELQHALAHLTSLTPKPKRKNKFRIVVYCIIYINRIYQKLSEKDFKGLGSLGYEYLLRTLSSEISLKETLSNKNNIENSYMLYEDLFMNNILFKECAYKLKTSELQCKNLLIINTDNQILLEKAQKEIVDQKNMTSQITNDTAVGIKSVKEFMHQEHLKCIRKEKTLQQIQRNISQYMLDTIIMMRGITFSFDCKANIQKLMQSNYSLEFNLRRTNSNTAGSSKKLSKLLSKNNILSLKAIAMHPNESTITTTNDADIINDKEVAKITPNTINTNDNTTTNNNSSNNNHNHNSSNTNKSSFISKSKLLMNWIRSIKQKLCLKPKKLPIVLLRMKDNLPGENLTTIDINAKREWLKQNKELQMSTVNAIKVDLKGIDLIRKESLKDMRLVDEYIYTLKSKYNEQQQKISYLEERIHSNIDIQQAKSEEKKSLWRRSTQKISNLKEGFTKLLKQKNISQLNDSNTANTSTENNEENLENLGNKNYFTSVINAIEDAKKDHLESLKPKHKRKKSSSTNSTAVAKTANNSQTKRKNSSDPKSISMSTDTETEDSVPKVHLTAGLDSIVEEDVNNNPLSPLVDPIVPVNTPTVITPIMVPTTANTTAPIVAPTTASLTVPNTDNTTAPTTASITAYIVAPTISSVTVPNTTSITAPTTTSITAPIAAPTTANITVPVIAPTTSSLTVPNTTSTTAPTTTSTTAPTTASITVPVIAPTTSSVTIPNTTSTTAPTTANITVPVIAPTTASITAPIIASITAAPSIMASTITSSTASVTTSTMIADHSKDKGRKVVEDALDDVEDNDEEDNEEEDSEDEEEDSNSIWSESNVGSTIDEDNLMFLQELERSKEEMLMLMKQEDVLLESVNKKNLEIKHLKGLVEKLTLQNEGNELQLITSKHSFSIQETKYHELSKENQLLREIVEEDYRYHTANLHKALNERDERYAIASNKNRKHQTTQVSCSVCAVRDDLLQHGADPIHQTGYDENTIADINEPLTYALNGGIVLMARPRHINPPPISHPHSQHTTINNNNQTKDNINQISSSGRGISPETIPFSLLNNLPLDNNHQATTTSSALGGYITTPTEEKQYQSIEQSKFSRLKKMPLSNSKTNNQRPISAQLLHIQSHSNSTDKLFTTKATLSKLQKHILQKNITTNTAAHLQNQLMEDEFITPTFVPVSSSGYNVPLSSAMLLSYQHNHHSNPSIRNKDKSNTTTNMLDEKIRGIDNSHRSNHSSKYTRALSANHAIMPSTTFKSYDNNIQFHITDSLSDGIEGDVYI